MNYFFLILFYFIININLDRGQCFKCGSTTHQLNSCPHRVEGERVSKMPYFRPPPHSAAGQTRPAKARKAKNVNINIKNIEKFYN